MEFKAIGLMSGSSLDGVDLAYVKFLHQQEQWYFEIVHSECIPYSKAWEKKLKEAVHLSAMEYQMLHTNYGSLLGKYLNDFINKYQIGSHLDLISSHGHTTFHIPEKHMTHQLGNGAAIAAATQLLVVSDLRDLDVAFEGQGAPIVPMGEKWLFPAHQFFLNIGGIANISISHKKERIAFDVCAANRVLNMLANEKGLAYDPDGKLAASGTICTQLLSALNRLKYFKKPFPKSLPNSFGTDIIYPLIKKYNLSIEDALATCCEHIAIQIKNALSPFSIKKCKEVMITGGGAFNKHLIQRIDFHLAPIHFKSSLPVDEVIMYKEALIMAFLGVLRFINQSTTLSTVTGAKRDSIGGALWQGK